MHTTQGRPTILCITATLSEDDEIRTMNLLGVTEFKKITCNPMNPRISFHNSIAPLDLNYVAELLQRRESCPRIIIFEQSLDECGKKYLELELVSLISVAIVSIFTYNFGQCHLCSVRIGTFTKCAIVDERYMVDCHQIFRRYFLI